MDSAAKAGERAVYHISNMIATKPHELSLCTGEIMNADVMGQWRRIMAAVTELTCIGRSEMPCYATLQTNGA